MDKQRRINAEKICLEVRRRSVLMLVASPASYAASFRSPIPPSHIEAACSASVRAVGNYTQRCSQVSVAHTSCPSSSLPGYNGTVGSLIDSKVASIEGPLPPSFSEYCAWRMSALPTSCEPPKFVSLCAEKDKTGFLALRLLAAIRSILSPSSFDTTSFATIAELVDSLASLTSASNGKINSRNYRILAISKLSSFAGNIISTSNAADCSSVFTVAFLLMRAFAPLSKYVSPQAYADCLIKSAALFDLCSEDDVPSNSASPLEQSQRCMSAAFAAVTTSKSVNGVTAVNCGKGFATIGRKRFDKQEYVHSILPILMSLACFERDPNSQQLHLRYALLGNALKNCRLYGYATTAYAVAAEISLCKDRGEQELCDLVSCSLIAGGGGEGGPSSAIVGQMIGCALSADSSSCPAPVISDILPSSTVKLLMNSKVGKIWDAVCGCGAEKDGKAHGAVGGILLGETLRCALKFDKTGKYFDYSYNHICCDAIRHLGRLSSAPNNDPRASKCISRHIAELYEAMTSGGETDEGNILHSNAQLVYIRSVLLSCKDGNRDERRRRALYDLSIDVSRALQGTSSLYVAAACILSAEIATCLRDEKRKVSEIVFAFFIIPGVFCLCASLYPCVSRSLGLCARARAYFLLTNRLLC